MSSSSGDVNSNHCCQCPVAAAMLWSLSSLVCLILTFTVLSVQATQIHGLSGLAAALSPLVDQIARQSVAPINHHSAPTPPPDQPFVTLRPWLKSLILDVPDLSTMLPEILGYHINFTLSDFACSQLTLGPIDSSFTPPASSRVSVTGIGIGCRGNWAFASVGALIPISDSGGVSVTISQSSLDVGITLTASSDGLVNRSHADVSNINIVVSDITFTGSALAWILDLLKSTIESYLTSTIKTSVSSLVATMLNTNLTSLLIDIDSQIRPFLHPPSIIPASPIAPPNAVNFRTSPVLSVLDEVLDVVLSSNLNYLIDKFTAGSGDARVDNLNMTLSTTELPGLGVISFGVNALYLDGLDSWSGFDVLVPVDNVTLVSRTSLDTLNITLKFFVEVWDPSGELLSSNVTLKESGQLFIGLNSNRFNGTMALFLDSVVDSYQLNQLQDPGCMSHVIEGLNITSMYISTDAKHFIFKSINPSGTDGDVDAALDNFIKMLTNSFSFAIPAFIHAFLSEPLRLAINQAAAASISNSTAANATCVPGVPTEISSGLDMTSTVVAFSVAVATSAAIGVAGVCCFGPKTKSLNEADSDAGGSSSQDECDSNDAVYSRIVDQHSLASSHEQLPLILNPRISFMTRYLVIVSILLTMGTFISSNTSVGASVLIKLLLDGQPPTFSLPSIFDFGLGNSIHDMWKAGVYVLAIFIALFSGVWPYLKLLLCLFCWISPVSVLSEKRRESFLMALDALGKWSLIDAFVLILMMVAFHLHIVQPGTAGAHETAVYILVNPMLGFHLFLIATISSLIISHVILHFHRFVEKVDQSSPEVSNVLDRAESPLCEHVFQFSDSNSHQTSDQHSDPLDATKVQVPFIQYVQLTGFGSHMVSIFLVLAGGLTVWGVAVPSFEFNFGGAVSILLEYLHMPIVQRFSVLSLGWNLPDASEFPDSIGSRWVQAVFFLFACVVPLLHVLLMLALWTVRMSKRMQRKYFLAAEILNAWSALEVFVFSIIAAILQIQQFVLFIVGDKCDLINRILAEYFDQVLHGDDQCFDVRATLQPGCWILFLAIVFLFIARNVVMHLCHIAISEQNEDSTVKLNDLKLSRTVSWLLRSVLPAAGLIKLSDQPPLNVAIKSVV